MKAAFAKVDEEFDKQWALVDDRVKAYLAAGEVKDEQWACTAAARMGLQINGERTDNRVEQSMSVAVKIQARHEDPLTAFVRYGEQHDRTMKKGRALAQQLVTEKATLIPWAAKALAEAIDKANKRYITDASCGAASVYVSYDGLEKNRRIIDFTAKGRITCTCRVPQQDGVPCHHVIVGLRDTMFATVTALSSLERLKRMFDEQYFVVAYAKAYDVPPPLRPLLTSLVISKTVRAPLPAAKRKAGPQNLKRLLAAEEGGRKIAVKGRPQKRHRGIADGPTEMTLLPKADPALDEAADLVAHRTEARAKQEAAMLKKARAVIDGVTRLVEALPARLLEDKAAGVEILRSCTDAARGFEAANRNIAVASAAMQASLTSLAAYSKDVRERTAVAEADLVVVAEAATKVGVAGVGEGKGTSADEEADTGERGPDDATVATEETLDTELDNCEFDKEDDEAELDNEYGDVQLFLNLHTGKLSSSSSSYSASAGK